MRPAPRIKAIPEDFEVRENLVIPVSRGGDGAFRYLLMRKCGYTTAEAISLMAGSLGLPSTAVTYAGMKDEDGVTEQLVAVPSDAGIDAAACDRSEPAEGRWLALTHYGHGDRPLEIGNLEGNGFRIVLRNVDPSAAERLASGKKPFLFLNYYDSQRFGVPGGPKRTHHVGAALRDERWDEALAELAGLRSPESAKAKAWTGNAKEFFRTVDHRMVSFYLAAQASAAWNALLTASVLAAARPESVVEADVDGLKYRFTTDGQALAEIMAREPGIAYSRAYFGPDGAITEKESTRSSVVQTHIRVDAIEDDAMFPGRTSMTLRFFLPSGTYATCALRQWVARSGSGPLPVVGACAAPE